MIERGKLQAIYNYLPNMWVSIKTDKGYPAVALIKRWLYVPMKNIYPSFIENEIRHRLRIFAEHGGDISSFPLDRERLFLFTELTGKSDIGDIFGEISPLLFYCDNCGAIEQYEDSKDLPFGRKCRVCNKGLMKQLGFVYTCSCGYAEPIHIKTRNTGKIFYHPNSNPYIMISCNNGIEKPIELNIKCKNCGTVLTVDNASSKRNFKSQSVTLVNLVGDNTGRFYDKGELAYKTVIDRWFGIIHNQDYLDILSDLDYAFRKQQPQSGVPWDDKTLNQLMENLPKELFERMIAQLKYNSDCREIDKYASECDRILSEIHSRIGAEKYIEWIGRLAFKLIQYYTIRDSKVRMELDDCITDMIRNEVIDSKEEVFALNRKLGIKDMMVTNDIELVTCVYGYTRRTENPASNNNNGKLKLNSFGMDEDGLVLSYGVKLNTEGILFDIDQKRIIEWLYINGLVNESQLPDMDSEQSIKLWYLKNIHAENISSFGNSNPSDRITEAVFGLLHSMSHAFLKEAGEISGLDKNSLAELIIMETASIFIYSQSEQGMTLGALSSMADLSYLKFLNDVYYNSRNCIFDPICIEGDSCCSACQLIAEVSCKYFNHNLGRKYLYTYHGKQNSLKGFWDMKKWQ